MCLYPRLIDNPKYKPNKKNGGNPPPVSDKRVKKVPIGCGNCRMCKKRRANEWKVRLAEELKANKGIFVTLSFSDKSLVKLEGYLTEKEQKLKGWELDEALCKHAILRFSDRYKKKYKRRPRRWFVTELGQKNTERIHLHGIIFEKMNKEELDELWQYGNVWIGDYCNDSTVGYIAKYMTKVDKKHKYYKGKVFASNGIGKKYTETWDFRENRYKGEKTRDYYRWRNGHKSALPMYYRNKIYSDEEKELLWLQKLEEDVRYVDGIRIEMSMYKDPEAYLVNVYKDRRIINDKLGYGDDDGWREKKYQDQIREQRRLKRHQKIWCMTKGEC